MDDAKCMKKSDLERRPRMRGRVPSRQATGLYVHSSPPTGVPVHDSVVRQWLRGGELARLRELVLEGGGPSLVGEYSPDVTARAFLRALPRILSRIDEAHRAAADGDVDRVERAVKRERSVRVELSKDSGGLGLLHKAVIHGHHKLQDWLLLNYPETVHLTDREKRTALHYAGSSPESEEVWKRLTAAGADPSVTDSGGNTPAYYMHHPRRARPPQPRGAQLRIDKAGLVVKPANIRIWIHDRDLGRLQKVVWEGHGQKLLSETSTQPKVRRFLNAVPYILTWTEDGVLTSKALARGTRQEASDDGLYQQGSIRDVHKAAIENDVETLTKKSEDPVPKDILLSKDVNGLNPLHKAAGLGQKEAMQEILGRAPEAANAQDNLGRTPLHYAAGLRDPELYQLLVEAGATDHLQDKKGNTPSYYRSKPAELEGGKLLNLVPEAPRTAHIFPPSWDWRLLQTPGTGVRLQDSVEGLTQESTAEEITQEDVSKDDPVEESRPDMSEDEGVGSENAQSVDDNISPQNSENIDMEPEDEEDRLGQTVTIAKSEMFGEDSGVTEAELGVTEHSQDMNKNNIEHNENELESTKEELDVEKALQQNEPNKAEENDDKDLPKENFAESTENEISSTEIEETNESEQKKTTEESLNPIIKSESKVDSATPVEETNDSEENNIRDISSEDGKTQEGNESTDVTKDEVNSSEDGKTQEENERTDITKDEVNSSEDDKIHEGNESTDITKDEANSSEENKNKGPVTGENQSDENEKAGVESEKVDDTGTENSDHIDPDATDEEKHEENNTKTENEGNAADVPENGELNQNINKAEDSKSHEEHPAVQIVRSETVVLETSNKKNVDEPNKLSNEVSSNHDIDKETGEKADVVEDSGAIKSEGDDEQILKEDIQNNEGTTHDVGNDKLSKEEGNSDQQTPPEPLDKTNHIQSGRQSLKRRVEKAIRLGRSHTTDDEDRIMDDLQSKEKQNQDKLLNEKTESGNKLNQEEIVNEENEKSRTGENENNETGDNKNEEDKDHGEEYPDSLEGTPQTRSAKSDQNSEKNIENVNDENKNGNNGIEENQNSGDSSGKSVNEKGERRSEAEKLVASGDMEGMAEMVLSGEGEALLDLKSDNPDVQLFINNVPQYMAKIEKVHKASREGDLRGVQTSLDRRKFAVARDNATSLKPTPLHVAVLFGRTSVLRYLAGRFPETMHAQDSEGRTPLHYATTLPDNGHFYSLLITLGADKAIPDNNGRTAEYYLQNGDQLTREMLLSEYQDRPVPIDTSGLNFNRYSDKDFGRYGFLTKGKLTGAEILREGYPIFKPEEGQYLASTLGEPLIKGLTEVAQLRPPNPIIHLANFLLAFKKPEDSDQIQRGMRSIEGTPAGHDQPKNDENDEDLNENEELKNSLYEGGGEEIADIKEPELEDEDEDEEGIEEIQDDDEDRNSPDQGEGFKLVNRDEHGQSMLHFAAARSHGRNAIFELLLEMDANPGLRDSLYRTARDVAEQMEISENTKGIDRYVVSLAARGEEKKLKELLLEGYDHITDADDGGNILDIVEERGQVSVLEFLKGITSFEENREKLHRAIRFGSLVQVQEIFNKTEKKHRLAIAKNMQGRTSLHVAVLAQHESTVEHIASKYPAVLHIGDNLMRTPLHYAMALEKVEPLSRILIAAGAQRVLKDLKGRQPSYYFMNRTDIQKLKEEEEALRV